MNGRRTIATALIAGVSALLCIAPAGPAHADTPASWESGTMDLPAAQRVSQGQGVKVAVLDTGVMKNHPALDGRVTTGPDFFKDDLSPGDPEWGDHGTSMASDVLKVAPKAEILSIRVINEDKDPEMEERQTNPVVQGIDYAVKHGADVISLSLGGATFANSFSADETQALARAVNKGVTVVAASGNDGEEFNEVSYPAAYPWLIAVAAVGKDGKRASFSTVHTYTSVAAPGVRIVSAKNTGGYRRVDGTSPAAALTSGAVALMLAKNDELSPAQVRSILVKTATSPAGGYNPMVGHGTINAAAAVRAAADPPADGARPTDHKGKKHFAKPNGVSPTQHPPMQTDVLIVGFTAAVTGLVMVFFAVRIVRNGRRGAAATAGGPPAGGPPAPGAYPYPPAQPPGQGQIPTQQGPYGSPPATPPSQPPTAPPAPPQQPPQ